MHGRHDWGAGSAPRSHITHRAHTLANDLERTSRPRRLHIFPRFATLLALPEGSNLGQALKTPLAPMAFTEIEIAKHMKVLEDSFWVHRRPPLHLRDKVREGQRFTDQAIELFLVRPAFNHPDEQIEEPIAKLRYVRSQRIWRIYWQRADGKWHAYPPNPQADSLATALHIIDEDPNGCFFG